ncbi:outer membrane protein assembly factor BamD [Psychrobacter sp. AOP22-C1-22]|uniref:outer membrane protein assembly factor BamD n=1 Tax=unclassified Psychrobacter TaxID=196806 RepID=UPI001787ACD4|nr:MULTISPECIES: outer membrane protein assembly factor BamD [unclassified Psychrobacter]MBE0407350.1 outer membrane protein assembly factor BamD [Psychrobacter sp. FME6]MBE0444851.1 outer membrane protein assembly factor BamD [Psychrobacter sp. FME5]MDN5801803.1 outer membrane protein assembly factor BamD [Psychrobacter sp.]MDN5891129.1 outer membrane protein assembly factor BamD [Psychrobacter sp.]
MQAVGNTFIKLSSITLLALSVNLVGCQTFKNLTGGKDVDAVETAEKSEQSYYNDALAQIEKGRYAQGIEDLTNLRTFYPTGQYAEQALLDMMYAQYESGKYEMAAASAEQFIRLYPSNPQASYAYYVRGVANMQGSSEGLKLFKMNQAERDTAYLRIAFANFQELINKYPNSPYAPDAAQRMTFIYNQFAESEMSAANWYIEREAYVAAVNRAKWVFQYYPLSESVPEAIAVLAYSHEKLGLNDLAKEYKTLLQINYPNWLTNDGRVKLNTKRESTWLNKVTFGKLGRSGVTDSSVSTGNYDGATKTQIIRKASQLRLPSDNAPTTAPQGTSPKRTNPNGVNVGLGLPEASTERVTSQSSTGSTAREAEVEPQNINPTRRTTLPNQGIAVTPSDTPADSADINDK